MLKERTVFVIGAGAGSGLNMPLGDDLSDRIAQAVNFYTDGSELTKGDQEIYSAVRRLARNTQIGLSELIAAGRAIAGGIRYTRSIDNYIYTHADNERIRLVAKIAIAGTIISAERASAVWVDDRKHPFSFQDEAAVRSSWMYDFFHLLQDRIVAAKNWEEIFNNLTIINFNYDRVIEHFLFRALQELYPNKDEKNCAELINNRLDIIHPYGKVGSLPWQVTEPAVRFGGERLEDDLEQLADGIRTYNEQIAGSEELDNVRTAIADAKCIIFLGFHFHQQNMDILTARERALDTVGPMTVYATSVGRSDADVQVIERRIVAVVSGRNITQNSVYATEQNCKTFFRDFGTTLAS